MDAKWQKVNDTRSVCRYQAGLWSVSIKDKIATRKRIRCSITLPLCNDPNLIVRAGRWFDIRNKHKRVFRVLGNPVPFHCNSVTPSRRNCTQHYTLVNHSVIETLVLEIIWGRPLIQNEINTIDCAEPYPQELPWLRVLVDASMYTLSVCYLYHYSEQVNGASLRTTLCIEAYQFCDSHWWLNICGTVMISWVTPR